MFILKEALVKWRAGFENTEQYSAEELEELQGHLLDEMELLRSKDLSEEESFMVACRRLGKPDKLEEEFKKIHPNRIWQKRFLWMISGFIVFMIVNILIRIVAKLMVFISSFITQNFSLLLSIELLSGAMFVLILSWMAYRILFTENSIMEKYIKKGFKARFYIPLIILVSVGQFIPVYLNQWMGSIHHTSYWETWSEYGAYLDRLFISAELFKLFLPLLFLLLLFTIKHLAKNNGPKTVRI